MVTRGRGDKSVHPGGGGRWGSGSRDREQVGRGGGGTGSSGGGFRVYSGVSERSAVGWAGKAAGEPTGRGVGRVDGCVEFEPPERVSNGTCNSAGRPGSTPTSGSGGRLPLGALGRSPRGWGGDGGGGRW